MPESAVSGLAQGTPVTLAVRSENIHLVESEGENTVPGRIDAITYKGISTRMEVSGCFSETVYPAVNEYTQRAVGDSVLVRIPAERICVYKKD